MGNFSYTKSDLMSVVVKDGRKDVNSVCLVKKKLETNKKCVAKGSYAVLTQAVIYTECAFKHKPHKFNLHIFG